MVRETLFSDAVLSSSSMSAWNCRGILVTSECLSISNVTIFSASREFDVARDSSRRMYLENDFNTCYLFILPNDSHKHKILHKQTSKTCNHEKYICTKHTVRDEHVEKQCKYMHITHEIHKIIKSIKRTQILVKRSNDYFLQLLHFGLRFGTTI